MEVKYWVACSWLQEADPEALPQGYLRSKELHTGMRFSSDGMPLRSDILIGWHSGPVGPNINRGWRGWTCIIIWVYVYVIKVYMHWDPFEERSMIFLLVVQERGQSTWREVKRIRENSTKIQAVSIVPSSHAP